MKNKIILFSVVFILLSIRKYEVRGLSKTFGKKEIIISLIVFAVIAVISFAYLTYLKPHETNKEQVKVYFSKVLGSNIVTEPVIRRLIVGQSPIKQAITALLEGPTQEETDKNLYSEIPEGTRIIKIVETPEEVRIDLNEQFTSGGGSSSMVGRLKEVVDTALENEPIRKVYLDIDGQELEVLGGEGLEVIQPLTKQAPNQETANEEEMPANN